MMREDWIEIELGQVLKLKNGYAFKSSMYKNEGVPIIRISDINEGAVRADNAIRIEESKEYENYQLEFGDILIAMSGATTGKFGIYRETQKSYQNQRVGNLKLYSDKCVIKKFIYYLLYSLRQRILKDAYGGAQPNISAKKVESIKFFLAPIPEQRAIVAKIEQLFSELDNGIANLKKAKQNLKIYRQAVLKKAFEGELTKEWREQQTNLSSADELLEQIKQERLKHYENQVQEWEKALEEWEANGKKGKRPTRISKPKTIEGINEDEIKQYGGLPERWKWTRFCNVAYKIGDIDHKMPKDFPGGLPYLSTGNLKSDGTIDFDRAKTISPEDFQKLSLKIKPEKGDIIFPRYGTIGRNILVNIDRKFLVSYSCAIIKNILKVMDEKYVYYYSLSPMVKKEIKRYTVQTTQANIGIASIERFVFPLCSKREQTQIVQEIETRLSVCDNILTNIDEGLGKAEALRQSILKRAFEGNLLSEWELEACRKELDWEPAEKLLDRIKEKRNEEA